MITLHRLVAGALFWLCVLSVAPTVVVAKVAASQASASQIPKRSPFGSHRSSIGSSSTTTKATRCPHRPLPQTSRKSRIDRLIDKAFHDADVNLDGTISFQEAYESILQMYIKLNRQANINPPSRTRVLQLYLQADATQNNRLNHQEFATLAKRVTRRAILRVLVHKVVTVAGAPALAELLVRLLAYKQDGMEQIARFLIPLRFQEKLVPVVISKAFHRTIWTVILVATLGNYCVAILNFFLDMSFAKQDDKQVLQQYKRRGGINKLVHRG